MKIQKISSIIYNHKIFNNNDTKQEDNVTFKARVDKGLERFYEVNKGRMPLNVLRFINSLSDKSSITPIEAQKQAFINLAQDSVRSVADIKKHFPGDPLFATLKEVEETKSNVGFLGTIRKISDILKELGTDVLKSGENLTVYLVKKLYLEAKTVPEINEDLERDLDELFKEEYKNTNDNNQYISNHTLHTLGIKRPAQEYINSLKFTRDGYSDKFADTISIAQKAFWDSLSDAERTAKARISVAKFEHWWLSKSQDEKLEMIAAQDIEILMKQDYQNSQSSNSSKSGSDSKQKNSTKKQIKVGSETLKKDDLFVKWAANNLKVFEAGLSEEDKVKLNEKRMRNMIIRWREMTPTERTEYISKMKTGSEPQRYVMINAWNNSFDLLKKLSDFLSEKQITKVEEMIYSKESFSEYMSRIMTEFWEAHKDEAIEFGEEISNSWIKINNAIKEGKFEQLKTEVSQKRKMRLEMLRRHKSEKTKHILNIGDSPEDYEYNIPNLFTVMRNYMYGETNSKLVNYFVNDLTTANINCLDDKQRKSFFYHAIANVVFSDFDEDVKCQVLVNQTKFNNAFKAAMNIVLKENIELNSNEDVYFSLYSIFRILEGLEKKQNKIVLNNSDGNTTILNVKNKRINQDKFSSLYNSFKEPLEDDLINAIAQDFFECESEEDFANIKLALKLYGYNALNIFSPDSSFSFPTRLTMYKDFKRAIGTLTGKSLDSSKCKELMLDSKYAAGQHSRTYAPILFKELYAFLPKEFTKIYLDICKECDDESLLELVKYMKYIKYIKEPNSANKNSFYSMPEIQKDKLTLKNKLEFLAMEAALTDTLYDFAKSDAIYGYEFESLVAPLCIKYNDKIGFSDVASPNILFKFDQQPNYKLLRAKYQNYLNQCERWLNLPKPDKEEALDELLFILNPDEKNVHRDNAILAKIYKYNIDQDI